MVEQEQAQEQVLSEEEAERLLEVLTSLSGQWREAGIRETQARQAYAQISVRRDNIYRLLLLGGVSQRRIELALEVGS